MTKKAQKTSSSMLALWFQDHLGGKLLPIAAVAVLAILVLLYFLGYLPERIAGLLLAGVLILGCCGIAGFTLMQSTKTTKGGVAVFIFGILVGGVALIPVISTLCPGEPAAQGKLYTSGQSLSLHQKVHGPIRVLLHGEASGNGAADIDVLLGVGTTRLETHLGRTLSSGRVGRGGRGTFVHEHNTEFVSTVIASEADSLNLINLRGALAGGLDVAVFPERFSFQGELIIAVVILLLSVALASRLKASVTSTALIACALVFGLAIYRVATPDQAIRPEFGALFIAVIVGTLSGGTLGWLGKKIVPAKR